jgi:hypothetical protein
VGRCSLPFILFKALYIPINWCFYGAVQTPPSLTLEGTCHDPPSRMVKQGVHGLSPRPGSEAGAEAWKGSESLGDAEEGSSRLSQALGAHCKRKMNLEGCT